jgi:hypothetical protein
MNKKLLILLVATSGVGIQIQANGGSGWGAFGGGLATGLIVSSAVNSGRNNDRDPAYWDYKRDQADKAAIKRDIRQQEHQVRLTEKKLNRAKTDDERNRLQKTLDQQNKRLQDLQDKRDVLG